MSTPPPSPNSHSRRRLLQLGAGLATLSVVGWSRIPAPSLPSRGRWKNLRPRSARVLSSLLPVMLPPAALRDKTELEQTMLAVDRYLTGLDPWDVLQINALLLALDQTPLLFRLRWRRFSRDTPAQQARSLRGWQTSGVALRRLAFRSLKTLCFLAWYQNDRAFQTIGYPGPLFRQFRGLPQSQRRYDGLLAPKGSVPGKTGKPR